MGDSGIALLLLVGVAVLVILVFAYMSGGGGAGAITGPARRGLVNGKKYYIVPRQNAQMALTALSSTEGAAVITELRTQGLAEQKWTAVSTPEGWWRFELPGGMRLDGNNGYGEPLHIWGTEGNVLNRSWIPYELPNEGGYCALYRVQGGALGVNDFLTGSGANLSVRQDFGGAPDQQFKFLPA